MEYLAKKDYPYFKDLNDTKHSGNIQGAFSFEEKYSISAQNSVDNENNLSDNDSEISQRFFGKYLGKGIMNMVQQTVEKEISEHVDISKTGDPVEHDKARDSLPYIKQMLERFNLKYIQDKKEYKDRLAAKIEYARRCFENDNRIRNETVRQVDRYTRQEGVRGIGTSTFSESNEGRTGREFREINVGIFKNVSNELSGAYKHFNELWKDFELQENLDEVFKDKHIEVAARKYGGGFDKNGHVEFETEKGKDDFIEYLAKKDYPYFKNLNDTKHSEKTQGAFSFEEKIQSALKKDPTAKILFENLGGKFVNGKLVADEKTRAKIESQFDNGKIKYSVAWHGTPHGFDSFSLDAIGTGDTSIKNFVADENLTSQQKLLKNFSGQMGLTLQFFKNDNADFRGAYTNGVTYLNVNANVPLGQVFWHESLHWLKSNNPKLFSELADAANLSDEQLQNYLDTTGRKDLKNRAEITEEILADSLHKVLDKVHDKNLLEKIIAWIRDTLSKFKEKFHNKQGGLTTAQYERISNAFGKMAKNLTDENGNKIFRFNSRTKNLELANGTSLDKISLDEDTEKISENPSSKEIQREFEKLQNTTPIPVSTEISEEGGENELKKIALKKFSEKYPTGVEIDTKIGKIIISKGGIKDSLSHSLYAAKADAVLSLPEGMEKAAYIGNLQDFEGNSINNHYFVYPIDYKGERKLVFCRVRERQEFGERRFYIHDVFTEKEINEKSDTLSQTQPPTNRQVQLRGVALFRLILANFYAQGKQNDISTVAKNLGGRFENGEWIFDDEKSKNNFERHLQNVENNFDGAKYSVQNFFRGAAESFAKKLHLKGEKIITEEMEKKSFEEESKKAMEDFIADPSDENKKRLKELHITPSRLNAYRNNLDYETEIGLKDYVVGSPSKVAEKNPIFRYFFRRADKAMDLIVKKRDNYSRKLNSVWKLVSDKKSMDDLTDLLVLGDMNEIEYGKLTDAEKFQSALRTSTNQKNYGRNGRCRKCCECLC